LPINQSYRIRYTQMKNRYVSTLNDDAGCPLNRERARDIDRGFVFPAPLA
jgi:hypothetical protein